MSARRAGAAEGPDLALEQVRAQVPTRISVGERLYTRFEFLPVLNRRLTDYVMPDVTWTGGISELKKIATLAEIFYIPISPHDASAVQPSKLLTSGCSGDNTGHPLAKPLIAGR